MTNLVATVLIGLTCKLKQGGVIVNEHTLSRDETRFHVEVLGRWFDFIDLQDLPARLAAPRARPFCLLTFDDGKRSNYTQAAPELERLGVPAVFFLTTDFVTRGSRLWFDRQQAVINRLGYCPPELGTQTLKRLPLEEIDRRLEQAGAGPSVRSEDDSDDVRPMSWDEARDLHRRGFSLGAHGVTHTILTCESAHRARHEIESSLAKVSEELRAPCRTFAFPNGNFTMELARHALDCGATSVMTTDPLWVTRQMPLWQLPRVQLFAGTSRARIETKLALASIRGALANPNGSGRRYPHLAARRQPAVLSQTASRAA
jgi:peptidoglycan/xylan/chitin deacetylase (PgdA/CDA1 family)